MKRISILVIIVILATFIFKLVKTNDNQEAIIAAASPSPSFSAEPTPTWTIPPVLLRNDHEMEDAYRPARFRSPEAQAIKRVIPSGAFLRDLTLLQGTNSYLVLYIIDPSLRPKESVMDATSDGNFMAFSCPDDDFGQTISGTYKLALVRDNRIVNEVGIPSSEYATGEEDSLMFRHARCVLDGSAWKGDDLNCKDSGIDFLETRQLMMMDMTGDGLPYEVRFMTEYLSCGNDLYVMAGYDKKSDKVVIYNVVDDNGTHPYYEDFEPHADGKVLHTTGCDHGATKHTVRRFRFNEAKNAYVQYYSSGIFDCDYSGWYPGKLKTWSE